MPRRFPGRRPEISPPCKGRGDRSAEIGGQHLVVVGRQRHAVVSEAHREAGALMLVNLAAVVEAEFFGIVPVEYDQEPHAPPRSVAVRRLVWCRRKSGASALIQSVSFALSIISAILPCTSASPPMSQTYRSPGSTVI